MIALEKITIDDFAALLNEVFSMKIEEGLNIPAELVEVTALDTYSPLERSPFRLTFRTDQVNEYFEQAIFNIEHKDFPNLSIFLSPKGYDGTGMKYEAIFA